MRWLHARSRKRSSSPTRFVRPQLMRLEEREVLDATPSLLYLPALQSFLPALTNSILAFENSLQTELAVFATQLTNLNQELNHLQNGYYYLLQTIQQIDHALLNSAPPSAPPSNTPPSTPPLALSSFAGVYRAAQVPYSVQGDIPAGTQQRVYLTLHADGSGQIFIAPFDGTNLTLNFNAGSFTYANGTIGYTYPSGLTSYIQLSVTPAPGNQLTGSLVGHGNWGQGGSFVAFSFSNLSFVKES
jgi:hypothetical protein